MKKHALNALLALSLVANAGYGMDFDEPIREGGGASAETAAVQAFEDIFPPREKDIEHVTALANPPADLPTLPLMSYKMPLNFMSWVRGAGLRIETKAPPPGAMIFFNSALDQTIKDANGKASFEIPQAVKGYDFGLSLPFESSSNIHRILSHILNCKRIAKEDQQLSILDIASGHAFSGLQFFMKDANIVWDGMDLNPQLVQFFKKHTKPLLEKVDAKKAKRFSLVKGDARDSSGILFTASKRDMVTAFNLFHYLDVQDWPAVLSNIHTSLKPDGFAVFSVVLNEFAEKGLSDFIIGIKGIVNLALKAPSPPEMTFESLKTFLRGCPILIGASDTELEVGISKALEGRLFPAKQIERSTRDRFYVPNESFPSPGTLIDNGKVMPYFFNVPQAIHCIEHTGHFKAESYAIVNSITGDIVSREDALSLSLTRTAFTIYVIATPVSLSSLAKGAAGGAGKE